MKAACWEESRSRSSAASKIPGKIRSRSLPVTRCGRADARQGRPDRVDWPGRHPPRRSDRKARLGYACGRGTLESRRKRAANRLRRWLEYGPAPELVTSAPDLDGDGTGDLVWVSRQMPSFLALSGRNGSVLWEHELELDIAGVTPPDDPQTTRPDPGRTQNRVARRHTVRGGSRSRWDAGPGRHDGLFRASNGDRATIAHSAGKRGSVHSRPARASAGSRAAGDPGNCGSEPAARSGTLRSTRPSQPLPTRPGTGRP